MSRGFGKIYHSQRLISKIKKLAGNTAKEAKLGVGGGEIHDGRHHELFPPSFLFTSLSLLSSPFIYLVVASRVNYEVE